MRGGTHEACVALCTVAGTLAAAASSRSQSRPARAQRAPAAGEFNPHQLQMSDSFDAQPLDEEDECALFQSLFLVSLFFRRFSRQFCIAFRPDWAYISAPFGTLCSTFVRIRHFFPRAQFRSKPLWAGARSAAARRCHAPVQA
jgi:hypothetical protein